VQSLSVDSWENQILRLSDFEAKMHPVRFQLGAQTPQGELTGRTKRRRADGPDDGSVGHPVVGGVVRPVVQDLTKCRRARRRVSEGCEICLVLQTHWYRICYNITQSVFVLNTWRGGGTCHPDDRTAGLSSFSEILDDGPDEGSPHW